MKHIRCIQIEVMGEGVTLLCKVLKKKAQVAQLVERNFEGV